MSDRQQAVRQILKDVLNVDTEKLSDSDPLFSSGIVDSFALLELITVLESKFGITISAQDTKIENLDSIDGICALVDAKADGSN